MINGRATFHVHGQISEITKAIQKSTNQLLYRVKILPSDKRYVTVLFLGNIADNLTSVLPNGVKPGDANNPYISVDGNVSEGNYEKGDRMVSEIALLASWFNVPVVHTVKVKSDLENLDAITDNVQF